MNGFSVAKRQGLTGESRARQFTRARASVNSAATVRFLGIVALGSGAALLAYILVRISLLGGLAFAILLQALACLLVWSHASADQRMRLSRIAGAGIVTGVLATGVYDFTKFALSHLEPSVYNPFDAIRAFGVALAGKSAPPVTTYLAGGGFHAFNGVMFGIAFAFFLGQRGILAGIAWGLFLEGFQLAFFPGWLSIKAYQEFTRVSALSHLMYGAVLGLGCQHLLGQAVPQSRSAIKLGDINS